MIKNLPTITIAVSTSVIAALLGLRFGITSHATPETAPVIRKTVPSFRCRACTPYKDLCPPEESLKAAVDDNARNFATTITGVFNDNTILGFETKRLRLREITQEDADDVYAYAHKPLVTTRTTWSPHKSKFETLRQITTWQETYKKYFSGPWGIEDKKTGRLIGTGGISAVYPSEPRCFISYCISDEFWGKGYELELIRALIEFCCIQAKCIRVDLLVREDDQFTQRIAEQAGMSQEGLQHDYKQVAGEFVSLYHYSILRREIQKQLSTSVLK